MSHDFFVLWLDEWLVYSCAYFNAADESLNIAQKRKLDYICRKLRLLDIGCGWVGRLGPRPDTTKFWAWSFSPNPDRLV